ncbi:MAG: cation transporter [Eubacterium sp.]
MSKSGMKIAVFGFLLIAKAGERKSKRVQALFSFLIGIIVAAIGFIFAYNGLERIMYPVKVSYLKIYALLLIATVFVKLIMGFVYLWADRKNSSPIFKALILDSFLDSAITIGALLGFFLAVKVDVAVDGIFSVGIGLIIGISAVKTLVSQAKFLIND